MAKNQTKRITSIGGQALMEGIMMRGPEKDVVASRLPNGTIETEQVEYTKIQEKHPWMKVPFVRGVVNMIQTFYIGFKALGISAEHAVSGDEEEEENKEPSKFEQWCEKHNIGDTLMGAMMGVSVFLGIALAAGLFIFLPSFAVKGFNLLVGYSGELSPWWQSPMEGGLRLIIFLAYMQIVSFMPTIKRMFRYHGAEHKTIFCYENDLPLTVENVQKQKKYHPRCGTSFLILMIIVGIIIGIFIPFPNPIIRSAIKIALLPVTVSLGYELIKLCGKHDNIVTRIIATPGLWIQRITVKEPDDEMTEVAIKAMEAVIPENGEDLVR